MRRASKAMPSMRRSPTGHDASPHRPRSRTPTRARVEHARAADPEAPSPSASSPAGTYSTAADAVPSSSPQSAPMPSLRDDPPTLHELAHVLHRLPDGKAAGECGVFYEMLKYGKGAAAAALARLLHSVWLLREVACDWSFANIVPVYKGKRLDRADTANYRPISLLSCIWKVLELVLNFRLYTHVETHCLISDEQGGFRWKRGTQDLIFAVSETIHMRREQGLPTFAAFLDVSSAYDTVCRTLLWDRLWNVGVRGTFLRIIQKMYESTEARVLLGGGRKTSVVRQRQGTAQGAVLSPMLYAIFIDPIVVAIKGRGLGVHSEDADCDARLYLGVLLYADDMVLMASSAEELTEMLAAAEAFANASRFRFNPAKTEVLVVPGADGEAAFAGCTWALYGEVLPTCHAFRYLGVMVSADGTWKLACEARVKAAKCTSFRWLAAGLTHEGYGVATAARLWRALAEPVLCYGSEIWAPDRGGAKSVRALHLFVARNVIGYHAKAVDALCYSELGWLPMAARFDELCIRYAARLASTPPRRTVRRLFELRRRQAGDKRRTMRGGAVPWCKRAAQAFYRNGLGDYWSGVRPWHDMADAEARADWEFVVNAAVSTTAWKESVCDKILRGGSVRTRGAPTAREQERAARENRAPRSRIVVTKTNEPLTSCRRYIRLVELSSDAPSALGRVRPYLAACASSALARLGTRFLARLRSGSCELYAFTGVWDRSSTKCPLCPSGEDEDVDHFVDRCAALDSERARMWAELRRHLAPLTGVGGRNMADVALSDFDAVRRVDFILVGDGAVRMAATAARALPAPSAPAPTAAAVASVPCVSGCPEHIVKAVARPVVLGLGAMLCRRRRLLASSTPALREAAGAALVEAGVLPHPVWGPPRSGREAGDVLPTGACSMERDPVRGDAASAALWSASLPATAGDLRGRLLAPLRVMRHVGARAPLDDTGRSV